MDFEDYRECGLVQQFSKRNITFISLIATPCYFIKFLISFSKIHKFIIISKFFFVYYIFNKINKKKENNSPFNFRFYDFRFTNFKNLKS